MNYKQQSNQGCLVVDLLYLFGEAPTRELEEEILSKGLFRFRDNYTIGCLLAFLDTFPSKKAKIYFDNQYYLTILSDKVKHPRLEVVLGKNDAALLNSLKAPYIVYVDTNITDGFTHLPHFMMITGETKTMYTVFDPWEGTVRRMSKQKILNGIGLLRTHIKICPFVITVG